jgi:hypothetical protein
VFDTLNNTSVTDPFSPTTSFRSVGIGSSSITINGFTLAFSAPFGDASVQTRDSFATAPASSALSFSTFSRAVSGSTFTNPVLDSEVTLSVDGLVQDVPPQIFVPIGLINGIGASFELIDFADDDSSTRFDFGLSTFSYSVSAIPEPSTWAMMTLGFAGIGSVAYRRRKRNADLAIAA